MALKDDLKIWNENRKDDLIKAYDAVGFRASGQWEKDLETYEDITAHRVRVVMYGSDYTYYMINGRKAGRFPPIDIIKKWVEDKKIVLRDGMTKEQFAYLVSRKIAREGITPTPARKELLTNVYTDERINQLLELLRYHISFDIKAKIKMDLTKR